MMKKTTDGPASGLCAGASPEARDKARRTVAALAARYPAAVCSLTYDGEPWKLLIMGRLSAQCTDARVNIVCRELFERFPTPRAVADAPLGELEEIIRPCGLYRNKSENLSACAEMLVREFGGEVPHTMEELTRLPGIGRKSANVVLGDAFQVPGFPVDTHVNRVLNRIGLVKTKSPEAIEAAQNAVVPPEYWTNFSHLLIQHGRRVCHAARPECDRCTLAGFCRKVGVKGRK